MRRCILAISLALLVSSAVADEIGLTCAGATISGYENAKFPAKFSESLRIDAKAKTINGTSTNSNWPVINSGVIEFWLTVSGMNALIRIDQATGRFVYGDPALVLYEGICK